MTIVPLRWQRRLDCASTRADIVSVAKDFVAQYSPEEIHELPWICRPRQFLEANDVTSYAFRIVLNHTKGGPETAARIHKLASFFSEASIALSRFGSEPGGTRRDLH